MICRLVLEGGFLPDEITPRPPLRVEKTETPFRVDYDSDYQTQTEATILGGLKTKNVDIVVTKNGIGPVLAVSCKGMTGTVRNLTNRLEETIGECTNIHLAYPTLVFGYLFLLRANRSGQAKRTDVVLNDNGEPVDGVRRFHHALSLMAGRAGLRDDVSRYESIALALVETVQPGVGDLNLDFPPADSPVRFDSFFSTLYQRYDERFVVSAPQLMHTTQRHEWSSDSPSFQSEIVADLDYQIRKSA